MSKARYTLRLQANVNGRQAGAYELDVESMDVLQALIDAAQNAMEAKFADLDAGLADRIRDERDAVTSRVGKD